MEGDEDLPRFAVDGFTTSWHTASTVLYYRDDVGGRFRREASCSVSHRTDDGTSLSVTSRRADDATITPENRAEFVTEAWLNSPLGRSIIERQEHPRFDPPTDLVWTSWSVPVDDRPVAFQRCSLGDDSWAAVGAVPGVVLCVAASGIPPTAVTGLHEVSRGARYVPDPPDLGDVGPDVLAALDERCARLPRHRVHRWADYWALVDIEREHIDRVTKARDLTTVQHDQLQEYWLARIDHVFSEQLTRWQDDVSSMERLHRSRIARHLHSGVLFQVWFNTLGPGARCWFGNRYTTIRHYTFRIGWRP